MKRQIWVFFGGQSAEHEVSIKSATAVINNLDEQECEIRPVFIDRNGCFHMQNDVTRPVTEPGQITKNEGFNTVAQSMAAVLQEIDEKRAVLFPIVHGTGGEDGTLQGFFEMLNLPYVASGVLASALLMDKGYANDVMACHEIPQANYLVFDQNSFSSQPTKMVDQVKILGYPLFIKPANAGSSVGVSCVKNEDEILPAFEKAFSFDGRVVAEEGIVGEELQISVLGNNNPIASLPGVYHHVEERRFLDYEAKYEDKKTDAIVPFPMPEEDLARAQALAVKTYATFGCQGIARVDIFYCKDGSLKVNEVNTLPGMTATSMVPKLWKATNQTAYPDLLKLLIQLAVTAFQEKNYKIQR